MSEVIISIVLHIFSIERGDYIASSYSVVVNIYHYIARYRMNLESRTVTIL